MSDDRRAPRFQLSPRTLNRVMPCGFLALGYAMYMRYLVIEQPIVGLACDGGQNSWLCVSRTAVNALATHYVFGWVGVGVAVLTLVRPTAPLFTIALAASAMGIVLYNGALAGLAAALLILCFARPAPAPA